MTHYQEPLDKEANSLKAISALEKCNFPYAAALLVYVVLERCLKLYLLKNRKELTNKDVELDSKVGKKLVAFRNHDPEVFVRKVLDCTLGDLEKFYRVSPKDGLGFEK